VRSRAAWVAGEWRPAGQWTLLGAVRRARLDFVSEDRYLAPGNGDDSGALAFAETAAALAVARTLPWGEAFAGAGRGFEAPTVVELAYRPDGGAGFNAALRPARFRTAEAGLRWRGGGAADRGWQGSATAWTVAGDGEIVPALNAGGRTSFANAGRTRRHGIEAALEGALGPRWRYALVGNWVRAEFEDGYELRVVRGGQATTRRVDPGNRVPGIPRVHGFAELAWRPREAWTVALEAAGNGAIPVDDANSDAAPGHVRLALALRWRSPRTPGWHAFARIDNLADRDAVGSVIVNEANGRAFEPLPARGLTLGLGWTAGL
jgi:iron complex outermembrane recepter protein